MTGAAKVKGDRVEREAAKLIADLLGYRVRRKLGAGRVDDEGDLEGIPSTVVQVAAWKDLSRALRVKPVEAGNQAANAGVPFAATLADLSRIFWFDHAVLREVLIRCACPIVCIGRRDPGGEDWHEWCERKADAALAAIEAIDPPPRRPRPFLRQEKPE